MKVKKLALIIPGLLLLAAVTLGIVYYRSHGSPGAAQHKESYHCPMHPTYVSDRPGECPICGMNLVKSEDTAAAPAQPGERKIKFYRAPMNPAITSKTPMKDEMGMDYTPVYEVEGEAKEVGGRAPIKMDAEKRQLIGVKTAKAAYRTLTHTVVSSGKVAYDPDLYQSISEYKEALIARDKVKDSSWPEVHERAEALIRASELRLRQLGLSEQQLDELAGNGGETHSNLLLPGAKAWLYAQIYEYEIGLIKEGQEIEAATPAYPGKVFRGVIKAVDSILSAETRTLRIRAEVENPDNMLKPEMYAEVKIKVTQGSRLTVQNNAIIDTGTRKLVFVDKGDGFEPREVKTGFAGDDYTEILAGVRAGETVVTSANFLIDSEARLKSSVTE